MLRPPEACRESLREARKARVWMSMTWQWTAHYAHAKERLVCARRDTRAIVAALRAARRTEGALAERWGVRVVRDKGG